MLISKLYKIHLKNKQPMISSKQGLPNYNKQPKDITYDFLIVGTGLVGATYARKLRQGLPQATILMIDAGAQRSTIPGENAKNVYIYNYSQDGLDTFSNFVKSEILPISRTPQHSYADYLPPSAQVVVNHDYALNGANPRQQARFSMPSAFSTFQVGGMGAHWTCSTPRPYESQRIDEKLINFKQMDELLDEAQKIYFTNTKVFQSSLRGQIILSQVNNFFKDHPNLLDQNRIPGMLPLAVQQHEGEKVVEWTGVDHILGEKLIEEWKKSTFFPSSDDKFWIVPQTLAVKLHFQTIQSTKKISSVQVKNLKTGVNRKISGQTFIVCGNSFYTPQLLHMSNIRPPALGHYLNEHPMIFCKLVLKNEHVQQIRKRRLERQRAQKKEGQQSTINQKDPYSFLTGDPIPNIWIPYTQKFPFHVQLQKDWFPNTMPHENLGIDKRLLMDIRFFMKTDINFNNRVQFCDENSSLDLYGLPQPTIHYEISQKDGERIDQAMKYMHDIAGRLGTYLKTVEPRLMPRGSAFHFMGTTRIGNNPQTSTCDQNSRVWGTSNLFVGGNGNIPSETTCNPTLTASAIAIKSCRFLVKQYHTARNSTEK